ncbi:MAG: hypothetical protein ACR2O8_09355 [Rhizobiaceae bacterium]
MSVHDQNKALITPFRRALYDYDEPTLRAEVEQLFSNGASVRLSYPFETLSGPTGLIDDALMPLARAMPDLERRDTIVMAGRSPSPLNVDWVGCCGCYTGTFDAPFLDIPPTGHQASLRFHEFFRFENG